MARGAAARHLARLAKACADKSSAGQRTISTKGAGLGKSPGSVADSLSKAGSLQQTRANAVAVQAVAQQARIELIPEITVDPFGAVSAVSGEEVQQGVFKNVDGQRFDDGRYKAFQEEISKFLPKERQYTDPIRTFAYGTDASFYRLNPKVVVKVHNQEEVRRILPIAKRLGVPVTFRAAGTSLSAQAITDSVLVKLSHTGKNFRNYTIQVSSRSPAWIKCERLRIHPPVGKRQVADLCLHDAVYLAVFVESLDWLAFACQCSNEEQLSLFCMTCMPPRPVVQCPVVQRI